MPNQHITLSPDEEKKFQFWYKTWARKANINPNPDDPLHYYDYRAAYKAGVKPQIDPTDKKYHWDSRFKDDEHPNRFVNGEDTKTGEPESTEDYYKKYTEDFQKWNKLPTKGKSWINYLPEEIVKGSPFIQKMMAISGSPTAQAVGRAYQPVQENISPEKIVSGLGNQVRSFTEGIAGTLTPQKIGEMLKQKEQEKDNVRPFLDIVESGGTVPMPPKEENVGIIKKAGEIAGGLGRFAKESVSYIPELLADFTSNPLKTIEERPLDILFMIEGSAGPKLRAKARAIKTKLSAKGFEAVKPEIENIVKEFQGEYSPEAETGMTYGPGGEQIGRNVPIPPTYKATPPSVVEGAEGTLGPVRPRTLTEIQSRKVPGLTTEQTGEGGWSPEALSRQKGYAYSIYDTKTGKIRPLPGVDAIDYQPKSFEIKIQENKITGKKEVIDQGTGAQGRRVPGLTIEQRPQRTPSTQEMYAEPLPGSEEWMAEALKNAKPREGFESAIPVEGKLGRTAEQPAPPVEKTPMLTRDKNYARPIPGALITVVDDAGRPILNSKGQPMSIAEYTKQQRTQQNIKAAEDFIVATTGSRVNPPEPPVSKVPKTPAQQLVSEVSKAKPVSREQQVSYSKERGARMAAFKKRAEEEGLTGQAWSEALSGSQSGALSKIERTPIIDNFTPEAIDGLVDMARTYPYLSDFEKISVTDKKTGGLFKLLRGENVQPEQLVKMQEIYGADLVRALNKNKTFAQKAMELLYETGNIPRSLMASFDLSAPFRQGVFFVTRPKQFVPAMGQMFKYFGEPGAYEKSLTEIRQRPNYPLMKKAKLSLTDVGAIATEREETFMSTLAEKIPGVKASNRAYSGFLNKLRADVFDDILKKVEKTGKVNIEHDPAFLDSLGRFINSATGRGKIAGFEKAGKALNAFFFSPRLMASRINMLNPAYYAKLHPSVRAEALKSVVANSAVAASVLGLAKLGGADVDLNPTSSDFLKMKIGNTRLDIMGGFSQYARLIAGVADYTAKEINKDILGNSKQKITRSGWDIVSRFFETKEAPAISIYTDFLKGKGFVTNNFNLPKEIADRLVPMVIQDTWDLFKNDPETLYMIVPGIFGIGLQTYEEKPKKKKKIY
jgi:hypothetical protein